MEDYHKGHFLKVAREGGVSTARAVQGGKMTGTNVVTASCVKSYNATVTAEIRKDA